MGWSSRSYAALAEAALNIRNANPRHMRRRGPAPPASMLTRNPRNPVSAEVGAALPTTTTTSRPPPGSAATAPACPSHAVAEARFTPCATRRGGHGARMTVGRRAQPFITPMHRGRLPACFCRHHQYGLHRPSGRTASRNTPSTIMSPLRSHTGTRTEIRLGVRAPTTPPTRPRPSAGISLTLRTSTDKKRHPCSSSPATNSGSPAPDGRAALRPARVTPPRRSISPKAMTRSIVTWPTSARGPTSTPLELRGSRSRPPPRRSTLRNSLHGTGQRRLGHRLHGKDERR